MAIVPPLSLDKPLGHSLFSHHTSGTHFSNSSHQDVATSRWRLQGKRCSQTGWSSFNQLATPSAGPANWFWKMCSCINTPCSSEVPCSLTCHTRRRQVNNGFSSSSDSELTTLTNSRCLSNPSITEGESIHLMIEKKKKNE